LTHFKNSFSDTLSSKFATKLSLKIPPHLKYVTALPRKILVSEKVSFMLGNYFAETSLSDTWHLAVINLWQKHHLSIWWVWCLLCLTHVVM